MLEIAIDIGGTFTDVVCLYDQQRLFLAKVPTTPHDLVQGVRQGVARVLELAEQPAAAVERFIHSTTIATNAYFVSTVGGAPHEVIQQYIEHQKRV